MSIECSHCPVFYQNRSYGQQRLVNRLPVKPRGRESLALVSGRLCDSSDHHAGGHLTSVRVHAFPCSELKTKMTISLRKYRKEFQKGSRGPPEATAWSQGPVKTRSWPPSASSDHYVIVGEALPVLPEFNSPYRWVRSRVWSMV